MTGLLIVNPVASRVDEESTAAVARILGVGEVLRTERQGHATELAREAAGRASELFVFSGDGGYNEVVNGLDGGTPVGFVPGGGTSVLPRALGLPADPLRAAEQLAARRTRRISLGRANGRRFAFSAGVGLDAEIIRRADAIGRGRTGRRASDLRIALAAARLLWERRGRFEPVLELRGYGRAAFALVANGSPYTYVGPLGLRLAPLARFELGLDVVAPRAVRAAGLPRLVFFILRGHGQERVADILHAHDLDRLELVCDSPQPLQLDGEDLGDVTEVVFEAERDALTVFA